MSSLDSFQSRKTLKIGSKSYVYYSLPAAEKRGLKGISRLPFSMKVLLELMRRHLAADGLILVATHAALGLEPARELRLGQAVP